MKNKIINWLYNDAPEWVWRLYVGLMMLMFGVIILLMIIGTMMLVLPKSWLEIF